MSILLNSNITTKLSKQAKEAMESFYGEAIDLTILSKKNQKALKKYKESIDKIYQTIGAKDEESIILTSCVEEATSQIFMSMYLKYILMGRKNSIVISARATITELKLARFLESQGCRVYKIPVTIDGTVDVELLKEYINSKTALVSIPLVDEESGVIQPIEEISVACSLHGVSLHCDASNAIGRVPVNVERNPVSFLSFGGATSHGPKEIAALYISKDAPELISIIPGRDSEQANLRVAPKEIANIIGFAVSLEEAVDAIDFDMEDVRDLRDELEQELLQIDGSYSLAPWALRVPNIVVMAFENVHASMLLAQLANSGVEASSFAQFSNRNLERQSLVEIAKLDSSLTHCVVTFSLNVYNSKEDIKEAIKIIKDAVVKIRAEFSGEICKEQK